MALDLPGCTVAVTGGAVFLRQAFRARLAARGIGVSWVHGGAIMIFFMRKRASGWATNSSLLVMLSQPA